MRGGGLIKIKRGVEEMSILSISAPFNWKGV